MFNVLNVIGTVIVMLSLVVYTLCQIINLCVLGGAAAWRTTQIGWYAQSDLQKSVTAFLLPVMFFFPVVATLLCLQYVAHVLWFKYALTAEQRMARIQTQRRLVKARLLAAGFNEANQM